MEAMKPRHFIICFDAHRKDKKVACVRVSRRWHCRQRVICDVPIESVYKGPTARQPRFYFTGYGYVTVYADRIHIGYGR